MSGIEALRNKLIRNFATPDASWQTMDRAPLYDGVVGKRLARDTAAQKLGLSVDIVPPGKRACPYHFHYVEEEMFIVLEGSGTLRVAGEMLPIAAGDCVFIPPGPSFPHQIINTSDAPLKYLSVSTRAEAEICEYPDSGKYLASVKSGPETLLNGGRMHRAKDDLDYWDGEA
jgi:uncharacterized cupin superfamily protein